MDVPLECPRLCGLCDRYKILKHIYGEENLAPNIPITFEERLSNEKYFVWKVKILLCIILVQRRSEQYFENYILGIQKIFHSHLIDFTLFHIELERP